MSVLIVLLAATGSMLPVCSTRQKDPVGTCQYASKFDSLKARNPQVTGRERESKQSSRGSAANTGGNVAQGSGFEGLLACHRPHCTLTTGNYVAFLVFLSRRK